MHSIGEEISCVQIAEGVSILPFVKNQSSYSLPFFYTFNSLFSPSIICLLIVSYSSPQLRQLPTVQQKR